MNISKEESNLFQFTPSVWIIPLWITVFNWSVFYIDNVCHFHWREHGIYPRTFRGVQGIFLSPFLHHDLKHIASNTIPLLVLTTALLYFYRNLSLKVLLYGGLLTGLITWCIGRSSCHIGASGLIYLLVSFIFFKGIQTKYYRLVALSLVVVLVYGGLLWYVFPNIDTSISWESHLAGLMSGLGLSLYYKLAMNIPAFQYEWENPNFDPMEDKFMQRFDENGNFVNLPEIECEKEPDLSASIELELQETMNEKNESKPEL